MSATQTIIITGGNAGLGFACAQHIVSSAPDRHVIIAARDPQRASKAVEQMRQQTPRASVETTMLDLASFDSIRSFVDDVRRRLETKTLPPLSGVVCNAGFQGARSLTTDGFERTFGVNHLGHYLLVNLLLPVLAPTSRIVVVASGVHDPAQLETLPAALASSMPVPAWAEPAMLAQGQLGPDADGDDATADRGRRYSTSKLANVYFTYGLAHRLPEGMTVNAFDPGLMPGTGLAREYPAVMRFVWKRILPNIVPLLRRLVMPNIHTTAESGAALARLVMDPALAKTNGRYLEGLKEIRSSAASYDADRAEQLWQVSARLTGLPDGYLNSKHVAD